MRLVVDFLQEMYVYVGVFLGGGKVGMPQKLLDDAQIGTVLQHVRCVAVTTAVGRHR